MLTKYSPSECCLVWKWIRSFLQQMGLPSARRCIRCRRCAASTTDLVSVLMELIFQWMRQIIHCKEANQYINKIIPVCNQCYEGNKQGQGWGKRRGITVDQGLQEGFPEAVPLKLRLKEWDWAFGPALSPSWNHTSSGCCWDVEAMFKKYV